MDNEVKQTKITIDNMSKIVVSGITKVYSAVETNISFCLMNENIVVLGKNLHVTKLDLDCHILEFEGEVLSIKKESNKQSKNIIKRIFG